MTQVIPEMRHAAFELMLSRSRAGDYETARLLSNVSYWESFPKSYSPEQLEAAEQFYLSMPDPERMQVTLARVSELSARNSWGAIA